MASKILSIEIGSQITNVIETDYRAKNPKIYHSFSFETPEGVFSDDKLRDSGVFRDRLQEGLNEHRIKTKKVLFILSSSRIANRDVVIPQVRENRILTLLHTNSSEYFPVDLQQYQLVYRILGETEEEGEKKYRLMVLAVPHEMIAAHKKLAVECGLSLEGLDYVGNAASQILKGRTAENVFAAVKIEDDSTLVTIVQNGSIRLQRNFSYGIGDAVGVIQRNGRFGEKVSFMKALDILEKGSFCTSNGTDLDESRELAEDLEDSFRAIIGNISRVINFYSSNHAGVEMESVILYGMGAGVMDLEKILGEELTAPVRKAILREKMDSNKKFYPLKYAVCVGAAIEPMDFRLEEERKKKRLRKKTDEEHKKLQISLTPAGFFAVCLVVSAVLLLAVLPYYVFLKVDISKLEKERQEKQYLADLYAEYTTTQSECEGIAALYASTETTSEGIGAFILEMEKKMPDSISLTSLHSDSEGILMEFSVSSKRAAAKVVDQIMEFESISEVEVQGLEEVRDELGNSKVQCVILCTYVNGSANADGANETTMEEDVEALESGQTDTSGAGNAAE